MKALRRRAAPQKPRRPRLAELLLEISNRMAVAASLAEAFEVLTQYTVRHIDAERASVFLHDSRTNELYTRISHGKFTRQVRMESNRGVAGHVFMTGRGVTIADAYQDEPSNPE